MNEFEQQILNALHALEVQITKELSDIRGDLKGMIEKVEHNITTDTIRLNKHSAEIDENRERVAKLEAWKDQFQKQIAHRIAISQSVTAIAAVVIAFVLSKFL